MRILLEFDDEEKTTLPLLGLTRETIDEISAEQLRHDIGREVYSKIKEALKLQKERR
jgi:hypothetical protein